MRAADDDVGAFSGEANVAAESSGPEAASVVANLIPGDLFGADDHPGSGVGSVVGLLEIVRGVQIGIGGVGVHLLANVGRMSGRAVGDRAIVLVMFEQNLFFIGGDEIASGDGRNSGILGPLAQVGGKSGRKLAHQQSFFCNLVGENGDGGSGLAVGGMEIEAAEDDAVLKVNPNQTFTGEIRSVVPGEQKVAGIAELNGNGGTGEDLFKSVGKRDVPAVVKNAIGDGGVQQFAELFIAQQVFGGRA